MEERKNDKFVTDAGIREAVKGEESRLSRPIVSDINCLNFMLAAVTLAVYGIFSALL